MKNSFLITLLYISACTYGYGQPYLDAVNVDYTSSTKQGILRRQHTGNNYRALNAGISLPVIFKNDSTILLFNPSFENWKVEINNVDDLPGSIVSVKMPVAIIKPLSLKWTILITAIPRWNGYGHHLFDPESFQLGFAGLVSYKTRPGLVYKWGIYYNPEFSGTFIMPLIGIDWKINEHDNLFGVLPGSMTYEHKISGHLYTGISFRAITNSYQAGYYGYTTDHKFLRVDDNQLLLFADAYLSKSIVIYMQGGHSVFRQLRMGTENGNTKYYFREKMKDDFVLKAGIAYRLRFR